MTILSTLRRACLMALTLAMGSTAPLRAQGTIHNDCFWNAADGTPIYSQGGGIFRFADPQTGRGRYYWYGVHYREAELYRQNPTKAYRNCTFEGVTCYVSDDLVTWTPAGHVLTRDEIERYNPLYWMGRMGVARVGETYAMLIQLNSSLLVCEADSPAGPFRWGHEVELPELIGSSSTGDQTVFTDEDTGFSYLVCSRPGGRDHIYVCSIGRDADGRIGLTRCTDVFDGAGREGNCMFKRNGKFYLCASNLYGWDSSYAYFLVADSVHGPYRPIIEPYQRPINDYPAHVSNDMQVMPGCESDYAHVSQTGFFVTLRSADGRELVVFCGDRWADFAGNGLGYNQWVPLSFEGDVPHFNSLSAWTLDASTLSWAAALDNNWCLNPSFEADRRIIPSAEKPKQDFLTGWRVESVKGSKGGIPLNTNNDMKRTTGEKTLLLTDNVPFRRRATQVVTGTHAAKLPDGDYRLQMWVKVVGEIGSSFVYVKSKGGVQRAAIALQADWQQVTIPSVAVRGGKAEIGLDVQGKAGAKVMADDVLFVKL